MCLVRFSIPERLKSLRYHHVFVVRVPPKFGMVAGSRFLEGGWRRQVDKGQASNSFVGSKSFKMEVMNADLIVIKS